MTDTKPLRTLCASLGMALALGVAASFLPENKYYRYQMMEGTTFEPLLWSYERIHFDRRPIDIAIIGPSKSLVGLSAGRIEQQLSSQGKPANVVNFSVPAAGRNLQWVLVDEMLKFKSPKLIVVAIDGEPYPYGHPGFKYVAPAEAIAFPPTPLLHDYFYDLAYLPTRKLRLFGASLFPNLYGLRNRFVPEIYAQRRSDFSYGSWSINSWVVDMEHEVPRTVLLSQVKKPFSYVSKLLMRALAWCCNDGYEHVYMPEIARLAQTHGANLLFVFIPRFNDRPDVQDRDFLERYGKILDNGDLANQDKVYQSSEHLNHAGALIASDRLANEILRSNF